MKKLFFNSLPSIIATLLLAGAMVYAAWTGPSQPPPNCPAGEPGCDAPINAGNSTQYKSGGLGIGGLFETNSETHLGVLGGKVGIGTTAPSEKLEVQGNIKIGSNGQVKNLRAENVSSLPAPGSAGRMVFNTSDNKMYFDNGTSWKAIGTQVALVGPLGVGIVQVPAEAYQVMCIVSEPGTSFNTTCNANRAYYNGANKIDVSTGDQHSGGGHVGAAIWDADGGGLLEGKRYFFSTVCLNFFWVTPSGGWCLQYEGCKEQDASIGSCYYTTLQ